MKKLIGTLCGLLVCASAFAQASLPPSYASATVAFGSVTASYTQFLAGNKAFVQIDILNNTDKNIRCSWDDGTTDVLVPAYSSYAPDLGVNKKYIGVATKCKHAGVAPTVGSVDIFALY